MTTRPRSTQVRGVVLLVGAAALLLLIEVGDQPFYWVPLLIGVTYLLSAAAGRSRGALWAPGWVLTAVGATEAAWFHAGRPADSFELAELTLLAAGVGAVIAVGMRVVRVEVSALGVATAVLLTGAFNLAEAEAVPHLAGNALLYAALLAVWGLTELAAPRRATVPA